MGPDLSITSGLWVYFMYIEVMYDFAVSLKKRNYVLALENIIFRTKKEIKY